MATERTPHLTPVIGTELVRRLVDTQFPQWAGLPLTPVDPGGSDHVIHRLGGELSVRLPRRAAVAEQFRKEFDWLPRLAPHLPLAVPAPVKAGRPAFGYPWPWSVSRWLDGEQATVETLADSSEAAAGLAGFLRALQRFTPGDLPTGDVPAGLSAAPLADRDGDTRAAIARFAGVFDAPAATALWNAALDAPGWDRPPVWFHGDFHTGNLLTVGGRLSAVIDFGGLGIGDPARDLTIAFTLLSARSRAVFRAALDVDEATWTRGRGWALATGLNAYTAYAAVDSRIAAQTTRQITEALIG
ncbi:aminoglycoside phosphotransferase family protein [Streptomyces sp. Isolate_45]|uniref:aminoglycoside phosphotransferase family protein n=1 Tax=Streptomyces sp. Isolate_45 TaxID=2950111 RepID=UPI002481AD1F|nr:aminoglycoside phosphotransferase family protein [Streptomyces sp. Isolate_45]MDA5282693.1 aminoglycoside phosphotransferase family protein [Streptomyces sp. Isolate_45]